VDRGARMTVDEARGTLLRRVSSSKDASDRNVSETAWTTTARAALRHFQGMSEHSARVILWSVVVFVILFALLMALWR